MEAGRKSTPGTWPLLTLFFIISASALLTGIIYYYNQRDNILKSKEHELSEISYLKIRQISQWRFERLGDVRYIEKNNFLVRSYVEYLQSENDKNLSRSILENLKSLTDNFDYKAAILLDTAGNLILSYPASDTSYMVHLRNELSDLLKNRMPVMTDFHNNTAGKFPHLDLLLPLTSSSLNKITVTGILALIVDPGLVLFPIIHSWASEEKSSETILLKREGNEIVYLNDNRDHVGNELPSTEEIRTDNSLASMAVGGITVTKNARDYRKIPVVAAMNKVPGTPWYLVIKIDRKEILSGLYLQMRLVAVILILVIISTGAILALMIRSGRASYYREKYETELNRLALVRHFDYILKYANDIILLTDSELRIVEANDKAVEHYQYTREELIGKDIAMLRAPEKRAELPETIREVNEKGNATIETIHIKKDKTPFPIELSSRVVQIEGRKYYQTIGRDITERKLSEKILKESEDRFRKIFEESPFSMIMTDKDFGILKVNSAFCNLVGYDEKELILTTFRSFTHPDHISQDEYALLKLVGGEIPVYKTDKRYIHKNGSVIWGSTTVSIIRNKNDEAQFFLAMIEDISSRIRSAKQLDMSVSLLKATLESTEDGLLVVDSQGKIVQYNQKFVDMWNLPAEILQSGDDSKALEFVQNKLNNPHSFLDKVKHLYDDPDSTSFDLLEFSDGRFFERYSQPQKIDGKSVGRVWSFRDITDRIRAENELIKAKEKAEESDRLKTAFLHNVSHEIRTPMNAIIGFSSLLNDPELTQTDQHQYVDIIFQSGLQLLSIITDIVDIANVESGQAKVNLTEFNLNTALKNLNEQFSIKVKESNVPMKLETGLSDEDSVIISDNTKLIQIISNLLNNAFKFTKTGRVEYGYELKDQFLEFFVVDTGIGIPAEFHEKIFDRFYQVDSATSRQYSGTGLGLSICKGFVELLGGKIWVGSELNKGTQFKFTIPYKRS